MSLKGVTLKEYTDKGFSGKDTDRPKFQELIRDIKAGLIRRVVVYKLDCISRSIIDFAGMMELFQQYMVVIYTEGATIKAPVKMTTSPVLPLFLPLTKGLFLLMCGLPAGARH